MAQSKSDHNFLNIDFMALLHCILIKSAVVIAFLFYLGGCAGMIAPTTQLVSIYSETPMAITESGYKRLESHMRDSVVAGRVIVSCDRKVDKTLQAENDSLIARATLAPSVDLKHLGWNTFNFGIGNFYDVINGNAQSHRDIRILELPRDEGELFGASSPQFKSALAVYTSLDEGNELVESSKKQIQPILKIIASSTATSLSLWGVNAYFNSFTRGLTNQEANAKIGYLAPVALVGISLLSCAVVALLGNVNKEGGSFFDSLNGYWSGFLMSSLLLLYSDILFDIGTLTRQFGDLGLPNLIASFSPFIIGSILAVVSYQHSTPLFILAQKKSLGLTESIAKPFIRTLAMEIPSVGVRFISTPTLQLIPSITLDLVRLTF